MAGEAEAHSEDGLDEGGEGAVASAAGGEPCMPCRGSGKVISGLGGGHAELPCPWCEGSGVRRAGVDAQAHWSERAGAAGGGTGAAADGELGELARDADVSATDAGAATDADA